MHVDVEGTRLWFDVEGAAVVPDGREMRARPTVVLVHGGPAMYDHSYFKPAFSRLTEHAQVAYLDLRGHGRSDWGDSGSWSFETCADDIARFCDAVGIDKPVVFGHSLGAAIVLLYAARHPGHAAGIVSQSGFARFDVPRLVEGIRRLGGDEPAEIARRSFSGGAVSPEEWAGVFALYGPSVPDADELARRRPNLALGPRGLELLREADITAQLHRVESPVLVCVGDLDPVTPVAASEEIVGALPAAVARLEVLPGAGHFPWKDVPGRYWPLLAEYVTTVA